MKVGQILSYVDGSLHPEAREHPRRKVARGAVRGVGDEQVVARRQHRLEQPLACLGPLVGITRLGRRSHQIGGVGRRRAEGARLAQAGGVTLAKFGSGTPLRGGQATLSPDGSVASPAAPLTE